MMSDTKITVSRITGRTPPCDGCSKGSHVRVLVPAFSLYFCQACTTELLSQLKEKNTDVT